jgi:hypothetical protein
MSFEAEVEREVQAFLASLEARFRKTIENLLGGAAVTPPSEPAVAPTAEVAPAPAVPAEAAVGVVPDQVDQGEIDRRSK